MFVKNDLNHLVSVDDLNEKMLSLIWKETRKFKDLRMAKDTGYRYGWDIMAKKSKLRNSILISDFFQPSTRTRFSFEAAMIYLGGNVIGTENGSEFSSISKGESLADNFKVISNYGDIIVGRFVNEGDARIAADASLIPVINGGDGYGEHPTQALTDAFTIMEKFPDQKELNITFIGDNLRGRTVHSLANLLIRTKNIHKMTFISPEDLKLSSAQSSKLMEKLGNFSNITEMNSDVIKESDIVYVTRIQDTMHLDAYSEFRFTTNHADLLPRHAIIMHPLPRNKELPTELDNDPKAHYFKQAANGLYVRMAILNLLCQK